MLNSYIDRYLQNKYDYLMLGGKKYGEGKKGGVYDLYSKTDQIGLINIFNILINRYKINIDVTPIDIQKNHIKKQKKIAYNKNLFNMDPNVLVKIAENNKESLSEIINNKIIYDLYNSQSSITKISLNSKSYYGIAINFKKTNNISEPPELKNLNMNTKNTYIITFLNKCDKPLSKFMITENSTLLKEGSEYKLSDFIDKVYGDINKLQLNKYVHRDIKGDNIMICNLREQKNYYIIDWGNLEKFGKKIYLSSPSHTNPKQTSNIIAKTIFMKWETDKKKVEKDTRGITFNDVLYFSKQYDVNNKIYKIKGIFDKNSADYFSFAMTIFELCDLDLKNKIRNLHHHQFYYCGCDLPKILHDLITFLAIHPVTTTNNTQQNKKFLDTLLFQLKSIEETHNIRLVPKI